MDDHRAHFLTLLGDVAAAAQLGELELALTTYDGSVTRGVPAPPAPATGADELDDTGYERALTLDGVRFELESVSSFEVFDGR